MMNKYTKGTREIKFRAWIKKDKKMFYQGTQYLQSFLRRANFFSSLDGMEHDKYGDHELMQFTGLKDKNGKEIYESDLVDGGLYGKGEVIWKDSGFMIEYEKKDQYLQRDFLHHANKEVTIVGNKYES